MGAAELREELTDLEKLRVGAYAAPRLRSAKPRAVKVVDKDGNVVRETTTLEVSAKALERVGIEFDVEPGKRKTRTVCPCGRVFAGPVKGNARKYCAECVPRPRERRGRGGRPAVGTLKWRRHPIPPHPFQWFVRVTLRSGKRPWIPLDPRIEEGNVEAARVDARRVSETARRGEGSKAAASARRRNAHLRNIQERSP